MSRKYLVDAIAQSPQQPLGCFYTAVLTLVQYHRFRLQIRYGPISDILYRRWMDWDTKKVRTIIEAGVAPSKVPDIMMEFGFLSKYIFNTPEAFEAMLDKTGPFVYVGRISGSHFHHTLVITGIENVGEQSFLLYNDPDGGRKLRKEFYDFLLEYMPSITDGSGNQTVIFYL